MASDDFPGSFLDSPLAIPLDERSRALRGLIARSFLAAGRGHLGPALSLVEILRVLYDEVLRVYPDDPRRPDRDRCILSKGHGCLALYAILADRGFFPVADLESFCAFDSYLGGHPEYGLVPGVEASTGALGHGLGIGIGMALAARLQGRPSRIFVIQGDGEINEGSVWESAMAAAKHRLDHLTVIVDFNRFQSYGPIESVLPLDPLSEKWRAFGFATAEVNGHDTAALRQVFSRLPLAPGKPSAVLCRTVKGKGVRAAENNADWHHKNKLTPEEEAVLRAMAEGR